MKAWQDDDTEQRQRFAAKLRQARLTAGLTAQQVATATPLHAQTLRNYERGQAIPRPWRLNRLAQAIGVPVASLLNPELVLAEVRISDATLERVKREGRPAAEEAGARIAAYLTERLLQEAARVPVDVSPGARPKRRRTREEVLAGTQAAKEARKQAMQRRRPSVE